MFLSCLVAQGRDERTLEPGAASAPTSEKPLAIIVLDFFLHCILKLKKLSKLQLYVDILKSVKIKIYIIKYVIINHYKYK